MAAGCCDSNGPAKARQPIVKRIVRADWADARPVTVRSVFTAGILRLSPAQWILDRAGNDNELCGNQALTFCRCAESTWDRFCHVKQTNPGNKKIMVLIGKYGADCCAGGFVARKYNRTDCMKWNSFRK